MPRTTAPPSSLPLASRLIYWRRRTRFREPLSGTILSLLGIEFPDSVEVGQHLVLHHKGFGTVVHPMTRFGDNVSLFHNVTIGRRDPWVAMSDTSFGGVDVGSYAVLCPGAVVLGGVDPLQVGEGTVVGANSTLQVSTGPWEIWAGSPARKIGARAH